MSSLHCKSSKVETKYVCLICQMPVCNRPDCAVFLSEETPNWKPGYSVSACLLCNTDSNLRENCCPEQQDASITNQHVSSAEPGAKARKRSQQESQMKSQDTTKRRKCLSLEQRVKMINYAKDHPNEGYRKVAEKFGIGRTQAQKILKDRVAIIEQYESNIQPRSSKRSRSTKYSDVNEALWEWYTLCRRSNIPVDGPMLQEEALLIAEKLGVSDLMHQMAGYNVSNSDTTSRGWPQPVRTEMFLRKQYKVGMKEQEN